MERMRCEFSLIRYVPDVVKGEFVNIGVLLREAGDGAAGGGGSAGVSKERRAAIQFTRDWRRVRCIDAEADIGLLEGLERDIAGRLANGVSVREPKGVIEVLEDTLANSFQMTEAKATLAENLTTEMETLMRMYVEPLKVPKVRAKSGRATIQGAMRSEFERAGVWEMMRQRIPAARFTRKGDPLRIDCGYEVEAARATPDAIVKMFQAVSLQADVDSAKGLALSARELKTGVQRELKARLELTAVVERLQDVGDAGDEDDESVLRYRFGVRTMEEEEIRVLTVDRLEDAAKTARFELGL